MNVFATLWNDVVRLLDEYSGMYLSGIWNTISLAVICTAVGCLIGLLCGILNTIPYNKQDPLPKRMVLGLIRGIIRI